MYSHDSSYAIRNDFPHSSKPFSGEKFIAFLRCSYNRSIKEDVTSCQGDRKILVRGTGEKPLRKAFKMLLNGNKPFAIARLVEDRSTV